MQLHQHQLNKERDSTKDKRKSFKVSLVAVMEKSNK